MKGELIIHYFWKYQTYPKRFGLLNGESVNILFPGDYNLGWGPDFEMAVVEYRGKTLFGDVEIHHNREDWNRHRHQMNPRYNGVLLHVFVKNEGGENRNHFGENVLPLKLEKTEVDEFVSVAEKRERPLNDIPGACGLFLKTEKYPLFKKLIFQASVERLRLKSSTILKRLGDKENPEEILFQKIFRALGYKSFADSFEELARAYPYENLIVKVRQSGLRDSIADLLACWSYPLGLTRKKDRLFDEPETTRLWRAIRQNQSNFPPLGKEELRPSHPYRPNNSPWLRLFSMFFHLVNVSDDGLLQSWLKIFRNLEIPEKEGKNISLDPFFPLFSAKENRHFAFGTLSKGIGKSRLLAVMVNAIIPFFLAYSDFIGEGELAERMVRCFTHLPAEQPNRKTAYMEARFGLSSYPDLKPRKNLGYHQGLIQIHDECCKTFQIGCSDCLFLDLLK